MMSTTREVQEIKSTLKKTYQTDAIHTKSQGYFDSLNILGMVKTGHPYMATLQILIRHGLQACNI